MHTHLFIYLFFSIFYYLCFWGLGLAQPMWGLGWTQPARPGHWPKPVARLGKRRRSTREVNSRVHE
jgi:hypothetical protein